MIELLQRLEATRRVSSSRVTAVVLVLAIALGWPVIGRSASADLVITHAKLISPPATVIENATIVVTDGKIGYAGPRQKSVPTAKRVIDARGRAMIPGLIDTHVHLNINALESQAVYEDWVRRGAPA